MKRVTFALGLVPRSWETQNPDITCWYRAEDESLRFCQTLGYELQHGILENIELIDADLGVASGYLKFHITVSSGDWSQVTSVTGRYVADYEEQTVTFFVEGTVWDKDVAWDLLLGGILEALVYYWHESRESLPEDMDEEE